ncbi:ATP-dependent rRNA helicase RRP3 [Ophiocordyceps sinensis CO18]|uniref:ATP-dependent rRNA helicase RRP3 n=1 Tax=Ophiocordyceps sinensis (strain Co18 / CGMCC 3.14243) TaxID=911162 RepID=T5ANH8_OPHSC|nr:ATP-dependent rRNA helicase RRP3 [Ophiocordyceps sinensis CO18]
MGDVKRRKVANGHSVSKKAPAPDQVTAPASVDESTEESATLDGAEAPKTFKDLGIVDSLCEACEALGYKHPTPIQEKSIPVALEGRDIIGLAETGSGKTAAFALPMLQALLDKPQPLFGPKLSIALGKKPHVIVATPGRLADHLEKTKGFSLRTLKFLVMDEADRLLDMDFGPSIDKLLKFIPRERRTYLFSATMSSRVESLQRASLRDPVKISISFNKYQTVSTLIQHYVFVPQVRKDTYVIYLINDFAGKSTIVFTRTVWETQRLAILLRTLGFGAIPLHGQLSQSARLGALNKFKSGTRDILVATDVASRGLDIPKVDLVLNYDIPQDSKTYIHRVGRTARAGKAGIALSLVTQYDIELFQRIEAAMGKKLDAYPAEKEEVMAFQNRVEEAQRHARVEMRNMADSQSKKGQRGKGLEKRRRDNMDKGEDG